MKELIDPNKYYTLRQIHILKILPFIGCYDTLKEWVKRDIKKDNQIFKALRHGKGTGTRYLIQGRILLKIIKEVENGKVFNGHK